MTSAAWLSEHLSDRDLAFLVRVLVTRRSDHDHVVSILRDKPDLVEIMLDDPQLYERVADGSAAAERISPHMLYAILIRQVRRDLDRVAHTTDYVAPDGRVPVFDAGELRAFLDDHAKRDYLVELLASFTQPASPSERAGSADVPEPFPVEAPPAPARSSGWRFSELDLAALERVRPLVEERDRFAVDRRTGDLSLFLAGTCAREETRSTLFDAVREARVAAPAATLPEALEALEAKAREAYQSAARHPIARATRVDGLFAALAESVHPARKVLNHLSERHLDPLRRTWFQAPLLEAGR